MSEVEVRESGQSVTSRALSILAAFENTTGSLSVSRIAQRAHLPLSTTYRLIAELASKIETGSMGINFYASNLAAPFGGWKDSGVGMEYGPEGINAYTCLQSIHRVGEAK